MPQMAVMLSFAGTDFTDALQLLIEILLCQIRSSFQPFIIHHPAFDGVVLGDLVYPFTKLYRTLGIDLEAYGNDHLKAIVLGIACDLTRTFGLNYPEIPDCYFTLVSIRWFSLTSFTALSTCTVIGNISTVARRSALYPFAVRYFRSLASVAESQLT